MAKGIGVVFNLVDAITAKISKPTSVLVFVMMCITTTEVVARYAFNHPTIWAWPVNRQIFGLFILVAGVYTMSRSLHIRIEILHEHFPPKIRLVAGLFALAALISFLGVLIWQGGWMGWNALMARERASGAFNIPLYPFKLLIPVGASLFLLQGMVVFFRKNKED
jgi:TRAP-type mannitol/chloroaromatic compound transport system permease small subunit